MTKLVSETDYLLTLWRVRTHLPVDEMPAQGIRPDVLDQQLPGARERFRRRGELAAEILRRAGVDPDSDEGREIREYARGVLQRADEEAARDIA